MKATERIAALDWVAIEAQLWDFGYAKTPAVLTPAECEELIALYGDETRFRSRVDMARYRFGLGDYKYFAHPLPPVVSDLRVAAYPHLAAVANRWREALGGPADYPSTLDGLLARCAEHGQTRPTPLLLHYEEGGYNCLHQDLYGDVVFPLQLTCMLSDPTRDFTGGEFLLVEQRPRMQSRGHAIALAQGAAIVFPCRERPARGTRGVYRVGVRHGVATVRRGERTTLGIIFHDAR